jgi:IS1 transposase
MWSFVGKKPEQRWLWHAIDHWTGTVFADGFGRRTDARDAPVPQPHPRSEAGAYARVASIAPSSQMLCLRVSGMTKMAIRNMINGSPMGYASAHPRLFVDR